MDINLIIAKLYNYGINFEDFQRQTGNLVGVVNLPTQLLVYNKDLTVEHAFYLVANKVFEAANLLAFGVPLKASINFKKVVGLEAYRDFKSAIYEEVNQRFLSNAFPEFSNSGSSSFSNISISPPTSGGFSLVEWVNPLSAQKIRNIDWLSFDLNKQNDEIFLHTNMDNLNLPKTGKLRVLQAAGDGTFTVTDDNEFAKTIDQNNIKNNIADINKSLNNEISRINGIENELDIKADKQFVIDSVKSLPTAEIYQPDKVYNIPQMVIFNGKVYWNLQNNNIGHIPGGTTGHNWWEKLSDIIAPTSAYELAYEAGTNTLQAFTNPNPNLYLNVKDLIVNQIDNLDKLLDYTNKKFLNLNLTKTELEKFKNNFFDLNLDIINNLFYEKQKNNKQIAFKKDNWYFFERYSDLEQYEQNLEFTANDYETLQQRINVSGNGSLDFSRPVSIGFRADYNKNDSGFGVGNYLQDISTSFSILLDMQQLPNKKYRFGLKSLANTGSHHDSLFSSNNFQLLDSQNVSMWGNFQQNSIGNDIKYPYATSYWGRDIKGHFITWEYGATISNYPQSKKQQPISANTSGNFYYNFQRAAFFAVKFKKDIFYKNQSLFSNNEMDWFTNIANINLVVNNGQNLEIIRKIEDIENVSNKNRLDKLDKSIYENEKINFFTLNDSNLLKTNLENQINTKLNITDFESNKNQLENQINTKVNIVDYSTDKTNLENQINAKLNISDFESNKNQLETEINKKLNTIIYENDKQNVLANKNEINNLQVAINNIANSLSNLDLINFKGNYNSSLNYKKGELVVYNDKIYICLKNTINNESPTNNEFWKTQQIDIDTSNFVTITELANKLNQKLNITDYSTDKTNLENQINAKLNISDFESNKNQLENQINTLSNTAAKKNVEQTFDLTQRFNGSIIMTNTDSSIQIAQHLIGGFGGSTLYITPDDNTNKFIKFWKSGKGRFNIDLEGNTRIMNVPLPNGDSDAISKYYLDKRINYKKIVNHTTSLTNPNSDWEWIISDLENNKIHNFSIKIAVNYVDYLFNWTAFIQNKNYKNMGPIFTFANGNDFNETCKLKIWISDSKIHLLCNIAVQNVQIWLKK